MKIYCNSKKSDIFSYVRSKTIGPFKVDNILRDAEQFLGYPENVTYKLKGIFKAKSTLSSEELKQGNYYDGDTVAFYVETTHQDKSTDILLLYQYMEDTDRGDDWFCVELEYDFSESAKDYREALGIQ